MTRKNYLPICILIIAVACVPFLATALKVPFYLTQLTMSAYYALVSLGLCMLMGYAGQISLGQAGFFSIGAYTSALVSMMGFSPWIGCIAGVALAGIVALVIGIPVLKLKGHYLAMATLGFGVIIEKIVRGTKAFGGADGLSNLAPFPLLPGLTVAGGRSLRAMNFYIAWSIVILGIWLLTNLVHSRSGRALRALHEGEEAANAMGVDTAKYKVQVFILGAMFAAVAGVFMSRYNGSIGPGEAGVMKSVRYVSIVAVGGMANLWGALISGTLLNFLSLRGVFGTYDDAVFGAILILVMLFAPEGFLHGSFFKLFRRTKA